MSLIWEHTFALPADLTQWYWTPDGMPGGVAHHSLTTYDGRSCIELDLAPRLSGALSFRLHSEMLASSAAVGAKANCFDHDPALRGVWDLTTSGWTRVDPSPRDLPWLDTNHIYPGRAALQLFLCSGRGMPGAHDATAPLRGWPAISDLRNKTIVYEMQVDDFWLPHPWRLAQHIQTEVPGTRRPGDITPTTHVWQYVNVIQSRHLICDQLGFGGNGFGVRSATDGVRYSGWRRVSVPLTTNNDDYLMLGSRARTGITGTFDPASRPVLNYGCATNISEVLANWNVNMMLVGVHLTDYPLTNAGSGAIPSRASGKMRIHKVELWDNT
jgi:hypothetical protein